MAGRVPVQDARIMRQRSLKVSQKARFRPKTTDSGHGWPVNPNRLRMVGPAEATNRVQISDITHMPTR